MPREIWPTISFSTVTLAAVTRWTMAIMGASWTNCGLEARCMIETCGAASCGPGGVSVAALLRPSGAREKSWAFTTSCASLHSWLKPCAPFGAKGVPSGP